MRQWIIAIVLILFSACAAFAAGQVNITLSSENNAVEAGQPFNLNVQVDAGGLRSLPRPDLTLPGGIALIGTPLSSQSFQLINGRMSVALTYGFQVVGRKPGKYSIGPATVEVRGSKYSSNTVTVQILGSGQQSAPLPAAPAVPDAIPSQSGGGKKPLFIRAIIDPTETVVGGQVIASYYFYTRVSVGGLTMESIPDFPGFVVEELASPQNLDFQTVVMDGMQYKAALVKRVALFPVNSGKLTVGSLALRASVKKAPRRDQFFGMDPFDIDSFFSPGQQVSIASEPVIVNVRPLPNEGRPSGFAGAVGSFQLGVALDQNAVTVNTPVTLKVVVEGKGNVRQISSPIVPLDNGISKYSESSNEEINAGFKEVLGKKTFEIILVPQQPGNLKVGPITLPYFDPWAGKYVVASVDPLTLAVSGQAVQSAKEPRVISKEAVMLAGQDLRYIRPDAQKLRMNGSPWFVHSLSWIFALLGPLAVIISAIHKWRAARLASDMTALRRLRASAAIKNAKKRLALAAKSIQADDAGFTTILSESLMEYIADKSDRNAAGLIESDIRKILSDLGAGQRESEDMQAVLDECSGVRFGGKSLSREQRHELLSHAENAVIGIEQSVKKRAGK